MRYLNEENPFIWVRFTTADSVTITIYKAIDNSVIVNAATMSELSTTGYFKYQFNPSPTELTEYFYIATNGIEEHAGKIILGGYPDSIKDETANIKTQTDKMNFTGDDIKATLDGEEVTTDTASRTASKATGFATENPPSQVLNDYKATGFSTHTPENVRTEIDNNSTMLSAMNDDIELIKKVENGRWKILNNQMVFYDDDNITPLLIFDLKDANGDPTESSPTERTPV